MNINSNATVENAITGYIHCMQCIKNHVPAKIGVGLTVDNDLQVWCENHDINIALIEVGD